MMTFDLELWLASIHLITATEYNLFITTVYLHEAAKPIPLFHNKRLKLFLI